ncbi:tyrosine-type recombinase/integrase [Komagataeibacter diospyri]|uniref:Phage DNA recombinase n=1 Tax=Komagataeibacter diospyri TaxID=1932662 RepID=A0A4P5NLT8_9PROT|nr:site-specific integrase [Komagataeibacter diospyri]GCE82690.1 phage DNA recombinase [Komagataeibacter diospyri]
MKQIQKRGKAGAWKYTGTVRLNGHSVSLTFPIRSQAKEWCDRVERAIKDEFATGKPFDKYDFIPRKPEKPKPLKVQREEEKLRNKTPSTDWTLFRAIQEYKETELENLKGFKQALLRLNSWQKSEFAHLKLNEITPHMLAQWIKERSRTKSPSTVRNDIYRISAIYELAGKPLTKHGWGLDISNPVKEVALPTVHGNRQRRLNKYEEEVLMLAISEGMYADQMTPFVIFAIETGMRKSEILSITKDEISRTKRGWSVTKKDTKNGHRRTIYLSSRAVEAIQPLYDAIKDKPDNTPLFSISSHTVENWFVRARDKAGLKDLRLHDLRHEAVSRLADKGLSVGAIASQSGHKSMQTLLRYINASEKDIRKKLEQEI